MPWHIIAGRRKYMCDCSTPAELSMSCYRCALCAHDLCRNCVQWDPGTNAAYCPRCWNVGKPYRLQIEDAQQQYEATVEALERAWREAVQRKEGSCSTAS